MKNNLDGGEAVVEALRNLGIKHVIMSPGSEWSPVWEALTRQRFENTPGPTYLQVWHETLAVNMATGYTFMTGEPQAVLLHAGVGPLQGAMGIHAAMQSEVPMLVMSGESITLGADSALSVEPQWYGGVSPGGTDKLVAKLGQVVGPGSQRTDTLRQHRPRRQNSATHAPGAGVSRRPPRIYAGRLDA